jgi:hypothetical protein
MTGPADLHGKRVNFDMGPRSRVEFSEGPELRRSQFRLKPEQSKLRLV